ncbi:hypothetical protein [Rothia terrae]|uniref:Uncharacterized protein n=1 Tax=Rothia terrae TaxID=396015 RepID=A0A7S6WXB7_9MICC|nr:hypothetical protein [Rothia terrae]QOW64814.1 hypothetical protein IDM49_12150 [Rothia terrae]
MLEQLKQIIADVPTGFYSLLAGLIPILGAIFLQDKKIKALQEVAEKNIKMLTEAPSTGAIHEALEEIVLQDLEKIKLESSRSKDWTSIFTAVVILAAAYFAGQLAWFLWGVESWILGVVSVIVWGLVGFLVLLGLVGLSKGWRNE